MSIPRVQFSFSDPLLANAHLIDAPFPPVSPVSPAVASQFPENEAQPLLIPFSHRSRVQYPFEPECFPVTGLPTNSLEHRYKKLCRKKISRKKLEKENYFLDYLQSNELEILAIQTHLKLGKRGLVVTRGTYRAYCVIALSNADCTGVVIVDSPRAKAINDFLYLLFFLATDREDFLALRDIDQGRLHQMAPDRSASDLQTAELIVLKEKAEAILKRLQKSTLPPNLKDYYLKNFDAFSYVFYMRGTHRSHSTAGFDYAQTDDFFKRVQTFVRAGRVISIMGDMGKLTFLKEDISVVDTSNLTKHKWIVFKAKKPFSPLVIFTSLIDKIVYCSSVIHEPLKQAEKKELSSHIDFLAQAKVLPCNHLDLSTVVGRLSDLMNHFCQHHQMETKFPLWRNRKALEYLRILKQEYCFQSPTLSVCLLSTPSNLAEQLNKASPEDLKKFSEGKGKGAAKILTCFFQTLSRQVYHSLSQNIPGWEEAEQEYAYHLRNYPLWLEQFNTARGQVALRV